MLLATLRDLCERHPLREKLVIVPSLAIGHQIGDALARGGTPWVNLRFETVRTIADAVAGFTLAAEGVTVLSRAQSLAFVERACDRVLGESSYFRALADCPGLHRAMQRSLDDLRMAGAEGARLEPAAFENERKAIDLRAVLAAYEDELERGRFIDRCGVISRAIAMLASGAPRPWPAEAVWLAIREGEWPAREARLVALAAGEAVIVSPGEGCSEDVSFVRAIGEENELRAALRSILESGTTVDDAEIAYAQRESYLPLAYEMTAEYGIPCTFAEGIAVSYTRPGRAALAFVDWIADGWEAIRLQTAARTGALATGDEIAPRAFARVLRDAAVGWGRERYVPRLDAWAAAQEPGMRVDDERDRERAQRRHAEAHAARSLAAAMLDAAGEDGAELTLGEAAVAVTRLVSRFAVVASEVDGMASAAIERALRELAALPPLLLPRAEAGARLRQALLGLHVAASNPRPGHLHVAPLRAAGWAGRGRLFVTGLDDGKHPGAGLQDPVLLDAERRRINESIAPAQLALAGDGALRAHEEVARLMARASDAKVVLSWSALELRERRDRYPAPVLLDIFRSVHRRPEASYEELIESAAEAGFVDERIPLTGSEWWIARRFAAPEGISDAVFSSIPALAAGEEARRAREGGEWTAYDGVIQARPARHDPRLDGRLYSASRLEKLASCPFQYFLREILRIEPVEDLRREPDVWLDPPSFGLLVHEVLEEFMRALAAANERPHLDRHLGRLREVAAAGLARWRELVPPPSEPAFARVADELDQACELFLRVEEEHCRDIVAREFELPFGENEEFRIELSGGRSIRLRGRIDRVDFAESEDAWHVWDYKTGRSAKWLPGRAVDRGRKLQPAIYARAVEMLLSGRVTRSGYYFPTLRGRGIRVAKELDRTALDRALELLSDVAGQGFFAQAPDDHCRYCDFNAVCGDIEALASREKRGHPGHDAWLQLQEVE